MTSKRSRAARKGWETRRRNQNQGGCGLALIGIVAVIALIAVTHGIILIPLAIVGGFLLNKRRRQRKILVSAEIPVIRRRYIRAEVKREVMERDSGRCQHCGSNQDIQFDHVIPFSKGGSSETANIQILCVRCNYRKGNRDVA
jgi:HNH endonuclease